MVEINDFPAEVQSFIAIYSSPLDLYNMLSVSSFFQKVCCVFFDKQPLQSGFYGDSSRKAFVDHASDAALQEYPVQIFIFSNTSLLLHFLSKTGPGIKRIVVIDGLLNRDPPIDDGNLLDLKTLLVLKNLEEFTITSTYGSPEAIITENVSHLTFCQQLIDKTKKYHFKGVETVTLSLRRLENVDNIEAYEFTEESKVRKVVYDSSEFKCHYWERERNRSGPMSILPIVLTALPLYIVELNFLQRVPFHLKDLEFPFLAKLEITCYDEDSFPSFNNVAMMKLESIMICFKSQLIHNFPTIFKDIKISSNPISVFVKLMTSRYVQAPIIGNEIVNYSGNISSTEFENMKEFGIYNNYSYYDSKILQSLKCLNFENLNTFKFSIVLPPHSNHISTNGLSKFNLSSKTKNLEIQLIPILGLKFGQFHTIHLKDHVDNFLCGYSNIKRLKLRVDQSVDSNMHYSIVGLMTMPELEALELQDCRSNIASFVTNRFQNTSFTSLKYLILDNVCDPFNLGTLTIYKLPSSIENITINYTNLEFSKLPSPMKVRFIYKADYRKVSSYINCQIEDMSSLSNLH